MLVQHVRKDFARFFHRKAGLPAGGVPTMQATAAATKAGFPNPSSLLKQLEASGLIRCPKSYTVVLATKLNHIRNRITGFSRFEDNNSLAAGGPRRPDP